MPIEICEIVYYDCTGKLYTAGINSIKDLFLNDLTMPLRLIRCTDRYKQAHQRFTDKASKSKTIVSDSLGSVVAQHILLEHEQLNGRLYPTPSLAISHERI